MDLGLSKYAPYTREHHHPPETLGEHNAASGHQKSCFSLINRQQLGILTKTATYSHFEPQIPYAGVSQA